MEEGSWKHGFPCWGGFDFVLIVGADWGDVGVQLLWIFWSTNELRIRPVFTCGLVGRLVLVSASLTTSEVAVHEVGIGCSKIIGAVALVNVFLTSGLLSLLGFGSWVWLL